MPIGAFTGQFDLPLLLVIVFVLFFFALVYYLHQEDKREGYPLVSDRTRKSGGRVAVQGFPPVPAPKMFLQPHGGPPIYKPSPEAPEQLDATGVGNQTGMPIVPNGEKLGSGMGPGSWVAKIDEPDRSHDGRPIFRPLRYATAYHVAKGEPDPMGFTVLGLDKRVAGTVVDIWIDETEHHARFLEIALADDIAATRRIKPEPRHEAEVAAVVVTEEIVETALGTIDHVEVTPIVTQADRIPVDRDEVPTAAGRILLPMEFAAVNASNRTVRSGAITAAQFAGVPGRRRDLILTAREENQLRGYYGGGYLWATPTRAEPLV